MYNYKFIEHRKGWYWFSAILVALSLTSIIVFGFNYGLDFTGGSLLEVEFNGPRPDIAAVEKIYVDTSIGEPQVQPSGNDKYIIRSSQLAEDQHQAILGALRGAEPTSTATSTATTTVTTLTELRFESIGPTIGQELKRRAIYAIVFVLIAIVAYLSYAFRRASRPVASWKYGTAAIIALAHDVIILAGVFSVLGHFLYIKVDSLFVTAILTLLGFSVHDTIVTLDRVRENLTHKQDLTFADLVNVSINETLTRSINTSVTTLFALIAIYFFGGETTKHFSLALIIGIIVGTYSSIFIASPLLVTAYRLQKK